MENKAQKKAEKFWDRAARSYDREEEKDRGTYQQIIERTRQFLKPTDTVLDLGCGTGLVSNEIAENVSKVDGIDLSSEMIEIARSKAKTRAINNVIYTHTTVFDNLLVPESYDVVLCSYLLHLLDKPEKAVHRIHDLLKPGGLLIAVTPCMGEKPLQGFFFSLLGKTNLVPKIDMLKQADLEKLVSRSGFALSEIERVKNTSNQYFTVSKK